jgi:hypothetical protein
MVDSFKRIIYSLLFGKFIVAQDLYDKGNSCLGARFHILGRPVVLKNKVDEN